MGVCFGSEECLMCFGFFFLDKFCVRVTSKREVGYGIVTK